ncbi:hypothetical protein BFS14_02885 [Serratia fonticola]|nr:hypothetical protein BFS14_02885 [Serratia fonticola]
MCLSENLSTENAIFCSRFQANSDGSVNYIRNPVSLSGLFDNAAEIEVMKFNSGESAFIDISIISGAKIERKLVFALIDRDGNGFISDTTISPFKSVVKIERLMSFNKTILMVKNIGNDSHKWIADISFVASRYQYSLQ